VLFEISGRNIGDAMITEHDQLKLLAPDIKAIEALNEEILDGESVLSSDEAGSKYSHAYETEVGEDEISDEIEQQNRIDDLVGKNISQIQIGSVFRQFQVWLTSGQSSQRVVPSSIAMKIGDDDNPTRSISRNRGTREYKTTKPSFIDRLKHVDLSVDAWLQWFDQSTISVSFLPLLWLKAYCFCL
jgi:hypothetical protein